MVRTVTWFLKFLKQDFSAISILERDSYVTVNTHFLHYKVKLVNDILFAVDSENHEKYKQKKYVTEMYQYFKVRTDGTHSKPWTCKG